MALKMFALLLRGWRKVLDWIQMIQLCLLFFSLEPQPLCDLCRGFYRVWVYGGYSGDLSPQLTLELLAGKEDAILIDVRPEVLRERDGIPDLRRAARFRYASITLPKDRYQVIVMDADGSRSKGIARTLRKLGVKRPYLVQGGFQSWVKQGIQVKELKPETVLTILNEGFAAASYALLGLHICFLMDRLSITFQEQLPKMLKSSVSGRRPYNLLPSLASVRRLLSPVRLGVQAFSCAAGKLENDRIGLPTSPSSSDVQNRGLKAAAKHESQPSETEVQNPSPESVTPLNEKVDLSEA